MLPNISYLEQTWNEQPRHSVAHYCSDLQNSAVFGTQGIDQLHNLETDTDYKPDATGVLMLLDVHQMVKSPLGFN